MHLKFCLSVFPISPVEPQGKYGMQIHSFCKIGAK